MRAAGQMQGKCGGQENGLTRRKTHQSLRKASAKCRSSVETAPKEHCSVFLSSSKVVVGHEKEGVKENGNGGPVSLDVSMLVAYTEPQI